jgi:hypothetical protein
MVRIQQSQWYAGLGIWGLASAIKDSWEEKVPYMLLAYIHLGLQNGLMVAFDRCMANEIAAGIAATAGLIAIALIPIDGKHGFQAGVPIIRSTPSSISGS